MYNKFDVNTTYPFYETLNREKPNYFHAFASNNMTFPPHLHSSVEIIYVLNGGLIVTINKNYRLMKIEYLG